MHHHSMNVRRPPTGATVSSSHGDLTAGGARPPFVVVLGPDGAGKSTLMRRLRQLRPDWSFASTDPQHLYDEPGLEYMSWTASVHPREYAGRLGLLSRTSFFAHIIGILHDFHILPALRSGRLLVCDSYDYRFRAKVAYLYPPTDHLIEAMADLLPRPDLIIWLDLPLTLAWSRKGGACTPFEGDPPDKAGFIRLQAAVQDLILGKYVDGTAVLRLDAMQEPRAIAESAIAAIAATVGPLTAASIMHRPA